MRTLVFYVSGHGFGHASRSIEVINTVLARASDVRVIVRTSAPKWLFDRTVRLEQSTVRHPRFIWSRAETDTGAVQIDSLHLDETRTVEDARAFMRTFEQRIEAEAMFLREHGTEVVLSDIPALGIAAADAAGVPGIGIGNFTWDWIYAAYDGAADVAEQIGEAYSSAALALRLPMHGGFATFPNVVDVPFVARRSNRPPEDTRRALGLPNDERLVLMSFGGYGISRIDNEALARLPGYTVVGSTNHPLDEPAMYDAGLRYEDVVRAVDVVVSKPGYGIISECIANDTALLYTSRGKFVEYDVLVREMSRYLRARFIDHEDLFSGNWKPHLDAIMNLPVVERPEVNGADIIADRLLVL